MRIRLLVPGVAALAVAVGVPVNAAPAIVAPTTTTPPFVLALPTTTSTSTTTTTISSAPPVTTATTSTTSTVWSSTASTVATVPTTTPPVLVAPTPPVTTEAPGLAAPATAPATTAAPLAAHPVDPPDPADVPLGTIDPDGAIPDGLDLTALPGAPAAPGPVGDGPQFAAGFSCAYRCIESGVAYPRGIGALLVVETHVPAHLFMSVIDEDNAAVDHTNSTGMVTDLSWALDHLEPGHTYSVLVAATDEHDATDYAYGEFTTLSTRTVEISVGGPTVVGGPTNIVSTDLYLKVSSLDYRKVAPAEVLTYVGWHRHVDLAVHVFRTWATSQYTFCEGPWPDSHGGQGDSDDECGTWNTAGIEELDVDEIPEGRSRWTEVSYTTTFHTPAEQGALPPTLDPRYFAFSVPVSLTVTYS